MALIGHGSEPDRVLLLERCLAITASTQGIGTCDLFQLVRIFCAT